ncbi:lytic murein transglycosylase B [Comamonas serinivorans]|uniref:Lytic murein transglycosylase B n=1 Tax=Comamonas serinivorans TaxID=1082851 RepID=A0A1Y0EMH4_9BURK|nr:lytic murein transglycosylase B [Comamonas serinivorans]ARU04807.1 lytic murein transglycosylase B [Comamonas serinivorans]
MTLTRRTFMGQASATATAVLAPTLATAQTSGYAGRADVRRFAAELQSLHGVDASWSERVLAQAQFLTQVPRLMMPPSRPGVRNWRVYRSRFVEPIRIRAGSTFWEDNAATLDKAAREFGVPPAVIVGVIGVETIYGRNVGNFRVLDALATLTFDFPREHPKAQARQAYFEGELTQFLVSASRTRSDPLAPVGSYAGAMGLPQFMPTSWAKFARDYDGDGRIDLWNSPADAIGSVANYLRAFGWQAGLPTHWPLAVTRSAALQPALEADILPSFTATQLQSVGVAVPAAASALGTPLAVVELPNGTGEADFVLTTPNFYVVTRYNWSAFYALAVLELGQAVARNLGRA